jgi:hypothetical protein
MSRLEILKSLHYPHRAVGALLELDEFVVALVRETQDGIEIVFCPRSDVSQSSSENQASELP